MSRIRWVDPDTAFAVDPAQPGDQALAPASPLPPPARPRPARRFLAALTLLILTLVGVELAGFLHARFEQHWALGTGLAVLVALVVVTAIAWIVVEIRAIRRLGRVDRARARLRTSDGDHAAAETARLIDEVAAALARRPGMAAALTRYRTEVQDTHEAPQRLALFARDVLAVVDGEAYRAVGRAARDVGVLTAVVPTALADTAVLVWRNVRMVREVAEIYGYRTGPIGTWVLIRRLLSSAALVAATDVAGGILAQQLGGALTEVVAAKLGGSAVATTRTLRLGLIAMQLCRAVPFEERDLPTLRRFMGAVLTPRGEADASQQR